jgi:HlyD family secretion protein
MSGIVSQLNSEAGEVVLGTSQFEGTHIMTIADLTRMEVEVEVDENDIVNLAIGDTTDIEVDALPDTTFRGIVSEIASSAVTRGRGTQEEITHFAVRVAFLDVVPSLRPGMSANVDIVTDRRENVVQVPIQAVTLREPAKPKGEDADEKKDQGGASVALAAEEESREAADAAGGATSKPRMIEIVFVFKDGKVEQRPVEPGISGETNMEIKSGLQDGEEIVVGNYRVLSRELKDGVSVKQAKPGKGDKARRGGEGESDDHAHGGA